MNLGIGTPPSWLSLGQPAQAPQLRPMMQPHVAPPPAPPDFMQGLQALAGSPLGAMFHEWMQQHAARRALGPLGDANAAAILEPELRPQPGGPMLDTMSLFG